MEESVVRLMTKAKKIEFMASLPPIQSAIQLDGMGDGARVRLEVPRSDVEAVLKLQELTGQSFRVVIEPLD